MDKPLLDEHRIMAATRDQVWPTVAGLGTAANRVLARPKVAGLADSQLDQPHPA